MTTAALRFVFETARKQTFPVQVESMKDPASVFQ